MLMEGEFEVGVWDPLQRFLEFFRHFSFFGHICAVRM